MQIRDLFEKPPRCEALYPEGRCKGEGRVEIVSRDWPAPSSTAPLVFCFDCAQEALASTIYEETTH